MNFELSLCPKIIFKDNAVVESVKFIKKFGKKLLFIYGEKSLKKNKKYDLIIDSLKNNNIDFIEYSGVKDEPTPELIDNLVDFSKKNQIDYIFAIGGGSVIDTAKAVSGLYNNKNGVENYLEGVGLDYKIINDPIPFIAAPTTAGSGAEVTKNAVITSRKKKYKKSFRDDRLLAKIVIADPTLTLSLPSTETAYGGMDALCQLIESFTTKKRNPFCSAISIHFIPIAIDSLRILANDPLNLEARSKMLQSSISSGITLANSGLGAAHGFASGLGGMFNIPHGLICAILLPHILKLNTSFEKKIYKDIASFYYKNESNNTNKFIDEIFRLNEILGIPPDFKNFKIDKNLSEEIVLKSAGSSMNGNPIDINNELLKKFITELL